MSHYWVILSICGDIASQMDIGCPPRASSGCHMAGSTLQIGSFGVERRKLPSMSVDDQVAGLTK